MAGVSKLRSLSVYMVVLCGLVAVASAGGRAPTDKERATSIEVQLRNDAQLVDDVIKVEVSGHMVRLSGEVDGAGERQRAEEVVRRTEPNATVDNRLTTGGDGKTAAKSDADEIKDEGKQVAHKVGKAAGEVGDMANDAWITSKIKTALMGTDGVHASGINVDTADGVVTLNGNVRSDAEREKAVSVARDSRGVVKVIDNLSVVTR
jgi:hyperosmotically inducible protein